MNLHQSQSIRTHDVEEFCIPLAVMPTQGSGGRWRHGREGVSKLPTPIFNRKSHDQLLNSKRDIAALRNQREVAQNVSHPTNHNASHPTDNMLHNQPTQSINRNSVLSTNQWINNDKEYERSDFGALSNSGPNNDNSTAAELQLNLSPRWMKTPKKDELSNFDSGCSVDQADDADDSCSCSMQDCCLDDPCTTDDCCFLTTDGCHSVTDRSLMTSDRDLEWD